MTSMGGKVVTKRESSLWGGDSASQQHIALIIHPRYGAGMDCAQGWWTWDQGCTADPESRGAAAAPLHHRLQEPPGKRLVRIKQWAGVPASAGVDDAVGVCGVLTPVVSPAPVPTATDFASRMLHARSRMSSIHCCRCPCGACQGLWVADQHSSPVVRPADVSVFVLEEEEGPAWTQFVHLQANLTLHAVIVLGSMCSQLDGSMDPYVQRLWSAPCLAHLPHVRTIRAHYLYVACARRFAGTRCQLCGRHFQRSGGQWSTTAAFQPVKAPGLTMAWQCLCFGTSMSLAA
jgi:hypothetical protein